MGEGWLGFQVRSLGFGVQGLKVRGRSEREETLMIINNKIVIK